MAKEQVISIKTGEAVQNLNQLRETIKAYKDELGGLELGSKEYKSRLKDLENAQALLRNAMHGTAASFTDLQKAATATNLAFDQNDKLVKADTYSYNALVRQLAALKEEWRATDNMATRLKIGRQINSVNDQLKKMDASVGVFGRNVGNYVGSLEQFSKGFASMGSGAAGVINPLRNMTMGFKTLSATPAIAVLGLLANLLTKVTEALKSSEDGVEGATSAMGVFSGISATVTSVLQGVAEGLGWLSRQFVNLLDKLGLVNDKMREGQEISQEEIRIARQQRDTIKQNADAERDIAELRAKSVDKQNYTAKQRIAFLEEASRKEEGIAARARKAAKDEYDLIVRKNAQTKSSAEALKAEADAYARMVQADTNYQNKVRQNTRETERVRREVQREEKERRKEIADAQRERLNAEKDYLNAELALLEKGSKERLAKQMEIREREYGVAVASAREKITNKEELDKQLKLLEKTYEADLIKLRKEAHLEELAEDNLYLKNRVDEAEKNTREYFQRMIELRENEYNTLARLDGESNEAYQARQIAAFNALKEARLAFSQWEEDQAHKERENELNALQEGSAAYLAAAPDLKAYELETLHQLEGESEAEFRARQLAAEKEYIAAKKALWQGGLDIMTKVASATSGILGSIADMYESNTDMTEAEAQKAKNLRIAGATIDMLQGAVTAFSTAQTLGPPMGPIVGAINAAAVVAAGIANIAKMKATEVNKNSESASPAVASPAQVPAPVYNTTFTQVRTLTGASEEERLNQPQQVYILSSDLEADRNARRVQVKETYF